MITEDKDSSLSSSEEEEEENSQEDLKVKRAIRAQCARDYMASRTPLTQLVSNLRKQQLALQQEKTAALRRLEESYNVKQEAVSRELSSHQQALDQECRSRASRGRKLYIEDWMQSGWWVYRTNPFYESIEPLCEKKTTRTTRKKKKHRLSDKSDQPSYTLCSILGLDDNALSSQIFALLGPMELFCVYRTSRFMRRTLRLVLSVCLHNGLARIHSNKPEAQINLLDGAMRSALAAYDKLCSAIVLSDDESHRRTANEDSRCVIPLLLNAAHQVNRALGSVNVSAPLIGICAEVLLDPKRTFVLSHTPEASPGAAFPYITPLRRCNVFSSGYFVPVYMAIIARYTEVYGEAQAALVAADPLAYFEEQDWLDLELESIDTEDAPHHWYPRGHLFVIDTTDCTITAVAGVGPFTVQSLAEQQATFITATALPIHEGCYSRLPPATYFIDHYAVRLALRKKMLPRESRKIVEDEDDDYVHHEVAIVEPTPIERVECALDRVLTRLDTIHREWREQTGAESLDLPLRVSIHLAMLDGRDDMQMIEEAEDEEWHDEDYDPGQYEEGVEELEEID